MDADVSNDEWMRYAHEAGELKRHEQSEGDERSEMQCIAEWVRGVEKDVLQNNAET